MSKHTIGILMPMALVVYLRLPIMGSTQVQLYPNPAFDNVKIDLGSLNAKDSKAILYNSLGKPVTTYELQVGVSTLNTEHLSAGLYLLVIDTEQGTIRKRVLIK